MKLSFTVAPYLISVVTYISSYGGICSFFMECYSLIWQFSKNFSILQLYHHLCENKLPAISFVTGSHILFFYLDSSVLSKITINTDLMKVYWDCHRLLTTTWNLICPMYVNFYILLLQFAKYKYFTCSNLN